MVGRRFAHTFPAFYACYLLKSIQSPISRATYIGSTPSPPRRIRQHNGEITQGAYKTRNKRPWVMQMIVHGFPSRLAALQFEWAWQHPNVSRHLRDQSGEPLIKHRSVKSLQKHIRNVQLMISNHPFNKWPLHVKLFTEEAVQFWKKAASDKSASPLPLGFTCSIELEGVDGKSGHPGSGRKGPIDVNDEQFTSSFLAKNTALLASKREMKCSICNGAIYDYTTDPLSSVLCPSSSCTSVSHMMCLSQDFLEAEPGQTGMIPRGGKCKSCQNYVLWGDVIRGCYRRVAGGAITEPDEDEDVNIESDTADPGEVGPSGPELETDTHDVQDLNTKVKSGKTKPKVRTSKQKNTAALISKTNSSEGENFNFDVNSSSDEHIQPQQVKKRGRPRKIPLQNDTKTRAKTKAPRKLIKIAGTSTTRQLNTSSLHSNEDGYNLSPAPAPVSTGATSNIRTKAYDEQNEHLMGFRTQDSLPQIPTKGKEIIASGDESDPPSSPSSSSSSSSSIQIIESRDWGPTKDNGLTRVMSGLSISSPEAVATPVFDYATDIIEISE